MLQFISLQIDFLYDVTLTLLGWDSAGNFTRKKQQIKKTGWEPLRDFLNCFGQLIIEWKFWTNFMGSANRLWPNHPLKKVLFPRDLCFCHLRRKRKNHPWKSDPQNLVIQKIWVFPKIGNPPIIHFYRDFHYKPSILGYLYFWKHPYGWMDFPKNFWFPKRPKRPKRRRVENSQEALERLRLRLGISAEVQRNEKEE